MSDLVARYPYPAPITAYGNGGFRFADMSHKGSILCLPSGIEAWSAQDADAVTVADFAPVLTTLPAGHVLLFGTGVGQVFPNADITRAFAAAGIGLEPMSTGAAARTYNLLLSEGRAIAAALIAVA